MIRLALLFVVPLGLAVWAGPASAQAIACGKAETADEKAICATYSLGQRDAEMATLYDVVTQLLAMGQRDDIKGNQQAWIDKRHACGGDVECLRGLYTTRIADLHRVFDAIVTRGPF